MAFVSRHRYSLVVALVLVSIGVSGMIARFSADPPLGPPLMIVPAFGSPSPSFVGAPSVSPSPSFSRSPVARRSPSPSATPSRSPSRSASASPAASPDFAARLFASGGRRGSVRGVVVVANQGAAAGPWTMVVVAPGVRVTSARGASFSSSGSTTTFTGPSLSPDKSVTIRFTGSVIGDVGPVTCRIEGRACEVTTRGIPG